MTRGQGGVREVVGGYGGGGDKVVVVVDLMNHRWEGLHDARAGGRVGHDWERRTPQRTSYRAYYGASNRSYCGSYYGTYDRFWRLVLSKTHSIKHGNVLRTFGWLGSDTFSHFKWTNVCRGDWSLVTRGFICRG